MGYIQVGDKVTLLQPTREEVQIPIGATGEVAVVEEDAFLVRFPESRYLVYFPNFLADEWVSFFPPGVNPRCPKLRRTSSHGC